MNQQFDEQRAAALSNKYGHILFRFSAGVYCGLSAGTHRNEGYLRSLKKEVGKARNKAQFVKALNKHDIANDDQWDFYSEHMQVRSAELFGAIEFLPEEDYVECRDYLLDNLMFGLEWVESVIMHRLDEENREEEPVVATIDPEETEEPPAR